MTPTLRPAAPAVAPETSTRALSGSFVWIWGVMLPLAAIAFEAASAILTSFIDPMPSVSYVFLLLSVPRAMRWPGSASNATPFTTAAGTPP
jgi:hypothetical protein